MQIMLMNINEDGKNEYLITLKGTKFTGSDKLRLKYTLMPTLSL